MKIKNLNLKRLFGQGTYQEIAQITKTPVRKVKRVMKEEQKFLLKGNESAIIPKGVIKRRKIAEIFLVAFKKCL